MPPTPTPYPPLPLARELALLWLPFAACASAGAWLAYLCVTL
jgi:hypothetical protein